MSPYDNVTLNIEITMQKYFVLQFIAMLKRMETNGKLGHSEWVAFFSDGDGSFRPKISIEGLPDSLAEELKKRGEEKSVLATCFDAT